MIYTYYKYVKNVVPLEIGGVVFALIALCGGFWLPESPVYLYNMFRFCECKEVLKGIA
jgi:hypothetical protein